MENPDHELLPGGEDIKAEKKFIKTYGMNPLADPAGLPTPRDKIKVNKLNKIGNLEEKKNKIEAPKAKKGVSSKKDSKKKEGQKEQKEEDTPLIVKNSKDEDKLIKKKEKERKKRKRRKKNCCDYLSDCPYFCCLKIKVCFICVFGCIFDGYEFLNEGLIQKMMMKCSSVWAAFGFIDGKTNTK